MAALHTECYGNTDMKHSSKLEVQGKLPERSMII